jgi:hypothetical protein
MKLKSIYKKILKEESYKIAKGNKSSKNSFGEEKLETPWATGDTSCCKDYGITCDDAIKRIKEIKSLAKLDEEFQNLFLQMNNEFDRYWFRREYKEIRDKIGKKEIPKPLMMNKNFDK